MGAAPRLGPPQPQRPVRARNSHHGRRAVKLEDAALLDGPLYLPNREPCPLTAPLRTRSVERVAAVVKPFSAAMAASTRSRKLWF